MTTNHEPQQPRTLAPKHRLRQGRVLLVGTLVLSALVLTAVFGLTKPKTIYVRTVSELARGAFREMPVRVEGALVRGSLCKVPSKCQHRFRLTDMPYSSDESRYEPDIRSELEVRYEQCLIPDTFRDVPGIDLSITVEGELCDGCRHFDAREVMVKCPSKYEVPVGGYEAFGKPIRPCESNGAGAKPPTR